MSDNQEWIARQERTDMDRREYEYERRVVYARDDIHEAMERKGLTKADLARALGTSRANITQVFSGARNVTLKTLSDLAWACGVRVRITTEPLRAGDFISSPVMRVEPLVRMVKMSNSMNQLAGDVEECPLMAAAG